MSFFVRSFLQPESPDLDRGSIHLSMEASGACQQTIPSGCVLCQNSEAVLKGTKLALFNTYIYIYIVLFVLNIEEV